jgi:hypothetical protein
MVTDVTLKRTQSNEIFEFVKQHRFDPAQFEWSVRELRESNSSTFPADFKVSVLTHQPSEYYFIFGGFAVQFSPSAKGRVGRVVHYEDWEHQLSCFDEWLHELRKEIHAPDLWASIAQEKALVTAASSDNLDNRPFSEHEIQLIGTKLDEIKGYILQGQGLNAQQSAAIEREIEYLKSSSERLGRKDWLNALIGGLFGLAMTLALEPEKARGLFALAGTVFQSLWGMAAGLLR